MRRLEGQRAFYLLWLGQLVSIFGSELSRLAFGIYIFQKTGSATSFALSLILQFAPSVLLGPFAGTLVDRWNRRLTMMISDGAQGIGTAVLLLLLLQGDLQIWHIYVVVGLSAVFGAFQFPAYSAAITMLVKRENLGRASGLIDMARFIPGIFAPLVAGFLMMKYGMASLVAIDLGTMILGIVMLFGIHIPQPKVSKEGAESRGSLWQETAYGFRFIRERKGLLALLSMFSVVNLTGTICNVLMLPYLLLRTGSETLLGMILGVGAVGGVLGGMLMAAWGGPKKRVNGVFGGFILVGTTGLMVIGSTSLPYVIAVGMFFVSFWIVILNGCSQAIWQSKVPPDLQGRVFATRRLIAQVTAPLGMAIAGPLADWVFEPYFGGGGQGMAVMYIACGALSVMTGWAGFLWPASRNVEASLPDVEVEAEVSAEPPTASSVSAAKA